MRQLDHIQEFQSLLARHLFFFPRLLGAQYGLEDVGMIATMGSHHHVVQHSECGEETGVLESTTNSGFCDAARHLASDGNALNN